MRSKEKYEELIRNSILFELNEDDVNYNSERYKLCNNIAEYYNIYIYKERFCDMGEVFMDTFNTCVVKYNKESGEFLNYFSSAFKQNYQKSKIKEEIANYRMGISVPEKKERLANHIIKYAQSKDLDINDLACREQLAEVFKIDIGTINACLSIRNINVVNNVQYNSGGEEYDLFDTIVEETRDDTEELSEVLLKAADKCFNNLQDRQKKLISLFFTRECFIALSGYYDAKEAHYKLNKYSFYNVEIVKVLINIQRVPTQKELAKYCGVSEQSASRSYASFKQKIKDFVNL